MCRKSAKVLLARRRLIAFCRCRWTRQFQVTFVAANFTFCKGLNHQTDSAQVESCVASVLEKFGRIDGAANCAGSIILKPAHSTTEEEFSQTIATNLNSSFSLLRCLARPMMKQKSGSIVFCSSAVAKIGLSNHEAIAAAKVIPFTKHLFIMRALPLLV